MSNTPILRFKGYVDNWENLLLGDIAEYSKGQGYSKNDLSEEGNPIILYGRLYTQYESTISEIDTFAEPRAGSVFSTGREVIIPASGETASLPKNKCISSSLAFTSILAEVSGLQDDHITRKE